MLSLNRPKDIQLLIGFLVFQGSKPITLELRSRRGGGFLGSNLPNHDAKGLKERKTKNKENTKGSLHWSGLEHKNLKK